jgi:hypothetical protein
VNTLATLPSGLIMKVCREANFTSPRSTC